MASSGSSDRDGGSSHTAGTRRGPIRGDRGLVLTEIAIAIPVVIALAATCAWLLTLVAAKSRAIHSAHALAQQIARGGDPQVLLTDLPGTYSVSVEGDLVRVEVRRSVAAPGPILDSLSVDVSATAVAVREPTW